MWMSSPTPLTISTMTIERRSSSSPASTLNAPAAIQVNSVRSCGSPVKVARAATAAANARATVPQPIQATSRRGRWPPTRPSTSQPSAGQNGIVQAKSATEEIHVVQVDRGAGAEDLHDDGQADHNREEHGELPVHGRQVAAEGDEGQVHRVEHQLDGHEDDQRVAPHQDADYAQREEQGAQDEVGGERHHQRVSASSRGSSASSAARDSACTRSVSAPFASTTAPIIPTSRITEASSNGSRKRVKSVRPTASAVPKPNPGAAPRSAVARVRTTAESSAAKKSAAATVAPARQGRTPRAAGSPVAMCNSMITKRKRTTMAPA